MAIKEQLPAVKAFLARQQGHFINGKAVPGSATDREDIRNPANGERIGTVARATPEEVEEAIASSHNAFKGAWAQTLPAEKERILYRFADLIEQHGEEIAQLETLQSGKLLTLSRMIEVGWAAQFLRYYAGWATKVAGQTLAPSIASANGEKYTAMTLREPLGVVFGIIPWNFPVMIPIWKLGAALATGNTALLKSASPTPFSLLRVAELGKEAGLPDGVLNVINGPGKLGDIIIPDKRIAKVSLTGSVRTGQIIAEEAMKANLKHVTLELGGKNAAGFLPDMSVQEIVDGMFEAGFMHTGQICAAAERFLVHSSQIDEVEEAIRERLAGIEAGDPMDEDAQFGPVATEDQYNKVLEAFATAKQEGDRFVVGGEAYDRIGYFVKPTVIRPKSLESTSWREEVFGPVATLATYETEEELIREMNDSPYGLTASVWTHDLSKALRLVPQVEAGTVWVNMHTIVDPGVPFGGAKGSGIGREYGSAFIEDYTELKSVMIRY
ncbi:aldehyde dehydrogenase family protein [Alteromonas lipolytica]|uniref:NAD-dependent phenylacetaldehyde dehydrogenase n=1 Tax=Alteromonas lipolytica TaxID=1856405 RepID=A0A1E8FCQ2_9ALTE|nr:aldehyde dehydrogenase family protein [Alteromonas lipolytica]OFI33536.1 NAD-dependent phenylacetaldehyde dehydrogenase [Alteromonas lipolytica]GGF58836.1 NAD-dependent phenylacetaldehyde dehydrogenase [Alteromonas lipolytica]